MWQESSTLDTVEGKTSFLSLESLGQDAEGFRLAYSQNILGQPHFHNKTEKGKKASDYVQGAFSTNGFLRASFVASFSEPQHSGGPLISMSDLW